MIKDIKKVADKVEWLLEKYPETRDCDKLLWLAYNCNFNELKKNTNTDYKTFKKWLMKPKTPKFESLSRARRKIQEKRKELAGNKKIRLEEAENVSEWAKGN